MTMAGPELAFSVNNKSNKTEPTFEYVEQRPIKIAKKSPYKKMSHLKGFHLGKKFWIGVGVVIVAGGIAVMKVNASEVKDNLSTPKLTFVEQPLITEEKVNKNIEKLVEDEFIAISKTTFNTIDFSYEKRKEEIPTREYSVDERVERKLTDELLGLFKKYASDYGFDPYLLAAICMKEASLNPYVDSNPNATGICQIENTNIGSTISAYNYNTGEVDVVDITSENLNKLETNIQIGAMMFRNRLDSYGDICIAIQSYNYSSYSIDMLIRVSGLTNPTYKELYPWIEDLHDNPQKYLPKWEQETYGSKKYVPNVLKYMVGNYTYINTNQNTVKIYDVDKNELVGNYRIVTNSFDSSMLENIETKEYLNVKNVELPTKKDYSK